MLFPNRLGLTSSPVLLRNADTGGGTGGAPPPTPTPATPPPPPPPAQSAPPAAPPAAGDGKTYTQADMDALDQKLQKRYTKSAQDALLGNLGFDSVDDLQAMVTAKKESDLQAMSEADRKAAEADQKTAEAGRAIEAAAAERMRFELSQALLVPGADPEAEPALNPARLEAAMAIALPAAQASSEEDPVARLAAAVAHTRATLPEVFGTPAGGTPPPTPAPTPPGRTHSQKTTQVGGTKSDGAAAMDAWRKNHPGNRPVVDPARLTPRK